MKNLSNQTFKVEEAFTMVNSVAKTSRLTGDTLFVKELIFEREDGNFYYASTSGENFRVFHRFSTNELELELMPFHSRNKEIIIKQYKSI